jgi:hypothetical protein
MGARPLRRAIQRYIEDPLSDAVLRSQAVEGSTIEVDRVEGKDGDEPEVDIKIKAPSKKRKKVAAGVGAEGDDSSDGAPELPEDPEVLPEAPDAPPADEPEPKPE